MNTLNHIIEPTRLLLTWQPSDLTVQPRTRRVVGEVVYDLDRQVIFHYLIDSIDFKEARNAGFQGFPSFDIKQTEFRHEVIESFLRRLPPRNREDFSDYLAQHRLPSPFNYSDFALLGYTGARLPSDGFALVPDFPVDKVPCDYLLEVAGLRHVYLKDMGNIKIGDVVNFEIDKQNPVDTDAIAIVHKGQYIGYVNRALKGIFQNWLDAHHVSAVIERLNGKPERPLVYVMVNVT